VSALLAIAAPWPPSQFPPRVRRGSIRSSRCAINDASLRARDMKHTFRALLRFLPADLRDAVAGDIEEEMITLERRRGRLAAGAWACWTAVRLVARCRWERTVRGRPLPPIGDEIRLRTRLWDSIRQDVVFGARMLRRQPGFTVVAVATLALAIGANTTMFTIVDAVLWRPLPFGDADALAWIAEQRPRESLELGGVSPGDFLAWRETSRAFTVMAATSASSMNLSGGGDPQRVRALSVSPGFLEALRVTPAGRSFRPDEEDPDRAQAAIVSDSLWQGRFGSDPRIVGRTILLNARPYEVVGVLPRSFWWPSNPEVLVPLGLGAAQRDRRNIHTFQVIARLRPGLSAQLASVEMDRIGRELERRHPDENRGHYPKVVSLRRAVVGDTRQTLLVLMAAVAIVLLIACANVATLLIARGSARRKEIAVRRALGAARGRIVRQCLTESLLLGFLGAASGVLLAAWWLAGAVRLIPSRLLSLPGLDRVAIDGRVLAVAVIVTVGTSVAFGLLPAMAAVRDDAGRTLNEEGRSATPGASTRRVRATLVVVETALSLVLLVAAVLLLASFRRLIDVSPGFDPHDVVTMRVTLPGAKYGDARRVAQFDEALLERLRAVPGIESAGAVTLLPFGSGDSSSELLIDDRDSPSPIVARAYPRLVSADYLRTMRIPLVGGRYFGGDGERGPEVAIVNQAAARRFWPAGDPLGQRISFDVDTPQWLRVVGVVADVKHARLDGDSNPEVYVPYLQSGNAANARGLWFVVRGHVSAPIAPALQRAVHSLDHDQPAGPVRPMVDLIAESIAPQRLTMVVMSAFAFVALILTATGLYGVMAFLVAQRTREIGVRMALGASSRQVLALIARQAAAPTGIGIAVGIAIALAMTRSMATLLFGVSAADPRVYALVSLVLAAVALAAIALPSVRAARIDPLAAIRDE